MTSDTHSFNPATPGVWHNLAFADSDASLARPSSPRAMYDAAEGGIVFAQDTDAAIDVDRCVHRPSTGGQLWNG